MTTALVIGDEVRIRRYSFQPINSQLGVNTMYYLVTNLVGTVNDTDVAVEDFATFGPFYQSLQSPQSEYYASGVSLMQTLSIKQRTSEVLSTHLPLVGNVGTISLPNQVSYVLALKTASASRHGKGRIFPPFPSATFSTVDGDLTNAGQVVLQLLAAQLLIPLVVTAGVNTATLTPTVRSVQLQPPPLPPLVSYVNIASSVGRSRFGTQRKRGQYGRPNVPPT